MSAGPIGFQYAAEVFGHQRQNQHPRGLLLLVGQISGIIMVTGMSMREQDIFARVPISFIILAVIAAIVTFTIKESALIIAERKK